MTPTPSLEPFDLRHTFGAYPTGVALIAEEVEGEIVGMLANSFTSVSLDPPLISMNFAHTSSTWPILGRAGRIGISVLAAGDSEQADLLRRPGAERFEGVEIDTLDGSAAVHPGAAATFVVELHSEIEAGDHVIALFTVVEHFRYHEATPLVFHNGTFHAVDL